MRNPKFRIKATVDSAAPPPRNISTVHRPFVGSVRKVNSSNSRRISPIGQCTLVLLCIFGSLLVWNLIQHNSKSKVNISADDDDARVSAHNFVSDSSIANHIPSSDIARVAVIAAVVNTNKPIYKRSEAIRTRLEYISAVNADAQPLLVGLGAEKSGSTSAGHALYQSNLVKCPKSDPKDTETRWWGECGDMNESLSVFLDRIVSKKSGQCSMNGYLNFDRWRGVSSNRFEKSVDYFGMSFVSWLFANEYIPKQGTKIFVMIRYPPPRIQSTYYFFVGNEKKKIADNYGSVDNFVNHLLDNPYLISIVDSLRGSSDDDVTISQSSSIFDLNWESILKQWNNFIYSLIQQCLAESKIAGFPPRLCNPPQLLRRAVGLSCYVVPIMQWIHNIGVANGGDDGTRLFLDNFRIIQTELYFSDSKDILRRLLCWTQKGTVLCDSTNDNNQWESKVTVKQLTSTHRSKLEMSEAALDRLHRFFEPCNQRLFELLMQYPQLALKEFDWSHWHYTPPFDIVD